ncbi:MAG: hypothetical protein RIS76_2261 [Verrucomicrobiota bacterium]
MIVSFADKETERIWREERSRRLPSGIQQKALDRLQLLHAATRLEDLRVPPDNRLEALKGDRRGQHGVRLNEQWRLCFRWEDGNAHGVEIVDCH